MSTLTRVTSQLGPLFHQGLHDIRSGQWQWIELTNSFFRTESFQVELLPADSLTTRQRLLVGVQESAKCFWILSASRCLGEQMVGKTIAQYQFLAYVPSVVYGGATWIGLFKPQLPLHRHIRKLYEWAIPALMFAISPKWGIFDGVWKIALMIKPSQSVSPKVHYLFEHAVVLPLRLVYIRSLRWDLRMLDIFLLSLRFVPQNPWLQNRIKQVAWQLGLIR